MGAYLSAPVTEKERHAGSNDFLEYGGASMQGWRKSMEDAHIAAVQLGSSKTTAMFGVFDGHGGSEVAKFCQKYMAAEILKLQHFTEGRVSDSLIEVFHKMDLMLADRQYSEELMQLKGSRPSLDQSTQQQAGPSSSDPSQAMSISDAKDILRKVLQMRQQGNEESSRQGADAAAAAASASPAETSDAAAPEAVEKPPETESMQEHSLQAGCAAVVALLIESKLYVANAGDSRAVLCRGSTAMPLSHDHKPAQDGEKARIVAAGGFISDIGGVVRVNGNLNLSRAIGDLKYKGNGTLPAKDQIITAQPDIIQVDLTREDKFFVLACDGVWDVMSNQEVVTFVAKRMAKQSLPDIASELLDACLASNPRESKGIGCDNMTAIIVKLKEPLLKPPP